MTWNETFLVHKKHVCMILTRTKFTGRSSFHFEKIEILSFFRIVKHKYASDLRPCLNPITPMELANNIIQAGKLCAKSGAIIAISSILPRRDYHHQINRVEMNILLRGLCKPHNFIFIENSNIILSEHLLDDGVYFNNDGTDLFSRNLLKEQRLLLLY